MKNYAHVIRATDLKLPEYPSVYGKELRKNASSLMEIVSELSETIRYLKNESAVLNGLCSLLNDAIFRVDSEGKIKYMNTGAENLFSIDQYLALGKPFGFLTGRNFQSLLKSIPETGQAQVRLEDKKERWFDASISVTKIHHPEDDKKYEYVFIVRDISDLTKMKDALMETSGKFNALYKALDETTDSVLITDKNNKIIFINRTFTLHTGYTYEDLLDKNPSVLQAGKTAREVYDTMWEHLLKGKIWQGILVNKHKEGDDLVDNMIIMPVMQNEEVQYFISIIHNTVAL